MKSISPHQDQQTGEAWSPHYDHCQRCGRTDRPHYAHGLCRVCYVIARHGRGSRVPWKRRNDPESTECALCGRSDKPHYGKGYCKSCYMVLSGILKTYDGQTPVVLAREGMRCQECGEPVTVLKRGKRGYVIHHKDHDKTNNAPENLALLCRSCHMTEHMRDIQQARRKKSPRCLT